MANQNLSQFTEKLFVADADHTFIWDSAASISKRVSRNSWLNSGTLASDAPVTISQTWSTTNTYTAFKVVANETAVANISSNLLELWSGNAATLKVRVDKQGSIFFPSGQSIGNLNTSFVCGGGNFYPAGTLAGTSTLGTASVPFFAIWVGTSSNAAFLTSDAANTLALRNGANAQTFNVYGTYTSGTSYERLTLSAPSAANAILGTNKGSGGGTARGLDLHTDGAARMTITTAGNVGIGTTSPTSKLHVAGDVTLPNGGSIFFGGGYNIYGATTATTINGPTAFGQVAVTVNGATKWVFNYDGLLCGGGTTAAFPALKRSSTTVQARLADDTAFAPIQGKLTTDTAYTATVVAATGYITIYDSTGAAYRVPCAV